MGCRSEWLARIRSRKRPSHGTFDDWVLDAELEQCAIERAKQNGNSGEKVRFCGCAELVIEGKRVPCPPQHSCEYCRKRSELVPVAVALADAILPDNGKGTWRQGDSWTRRFVAEMEKLSAPLLKQSGNGSAREQNTPES